MTEGTKADATKNHLLWREFLSGQPDLVPFVNFSSITSFSFRYFGVSTLLGPEFFD
jgi:hypothetical protein